jgi:hypothetical protein
MLAIRLRRYMVSACWRLALTAATSAVVWWGSATQADAYVYWANFGASAVVRANLDGSGTEPGFISGLHNPFGVAVDARYVYWTDEFTGNIGRADRDGTEPQEAFISAAGDPLLGVAVDNRYIYWTNPGTGTIGRANLDGTQAQQDFITGASNPSGVAVDDTHVYWTNFNTNEIGRANLDGTQAQQDFITGASNPIGVAVDDGPPGSASASTRSLAFATQPLATLGTPESVMITNAGHGNLDIAAVRVITGDVDDFLVSYDTCSQHALAPGAACTIHVRFAPSAIGERQALLALTSNDPGSPLQIALRGTAGELPQGPAGATGADGAAGTPGPTGAAAPPRPPGRPTRVRVVICRAIAVNARGHRVKRRHCTPRQMTPTTTLTIPGGARASLTRSRTIYASGAARGGQLVLDARRRLQAGRYTLVLRYRRQRYVITSRTPVTIT